MIRSQREEEPDGLCGRWRTILRPNLFLRRSGFRLVEGYRTVGAVSCD
jgi:hypothetical protein